MRTWEKNTTKKKIRVVHEVDLHERVLSLIITAQQKAVYLDAAQGQKLDQWVRDSLDKAARDEKTRAR